MFGIVDFVYTCYFLISYGFFQDFSISLGIHKKIIIDFKFAKTKWMISVSFGILFGLILIYQGLSGIKASQTKTQEDVSKHLRKTFFCIILFSLLFICKSVYDLNSLYQSSSDIKNTIYEFPHQIEKELERIYEKNSDLPYLIFQYPNGTKYGYSIIKSPECYYSEDYLQSLHKQEISLQKIQTKNEAFIPALNLDEKDNEINNIENNSIVKMEEENRNQDKISNFDHSESKEKELVIVEMGNKVDVNILNESKEERNEPSRILDASQIKHYNFLNMILMCKRDEELQFTFNMWTIKIYLIPILLGLSTLSFLIYITLIICCCRCVNKCNKSYERSVIRNIIQYIIII